jgi:hypothetical protein
MYQQHMSIANSPYAHFRPGLEVPQSLPEPSAGHRSKRKLLA